MTCAHAELDAAGPVSERLADIDSETGQEGEGAMGGEPDVALVLLSLQQPAEGALCILQFEMISAL